MARPANQCIDQIRLSFFCRPGRALHGRLDLVRRSHLFTGDTKGAGQLHKVNVRIAKITDHVLAGLGLAAAVGESPLARLVVAAIVENHGSHWDLVARHGPQRHGLSTEKKPAVALQGDYLLVGLSDLDTNCRANPPSERTARGAPDHGLFPFRESERLERLGTFGTKFRHDG